MRSVLVIRMAACAATVSALALPAAAQTPNLAGFLPGQWELRAIGGSSRTVQRSICVRSATQLIQLHHSGQRCSSRTLGQSRDRVSVRYECAGGNWGQTDIRLETPRLATIDTQGIASDSPFRQRYEARRTGDCG